MHNAGQRLRTLREALGMTLRDVESSAARIAERHENEEYAISLSRLSDIETKGVVPSVYRLYTLSVIYRRDLREVLAWYGIDLNRAAADLDVATPANSHRCNVLDGITAVEMPLWLEAAFDPRCTANLGRLIEKWGLVPLAYLRQFVSDRYIYAYVGSEDLTMYPLLPPGSLVQVDESKSRVVHGTWRSEYERPIYFVRTRQGYTCCWCTVKRDMIILQAHPLSPVQAKVLRHPQDAEVVGQVVGIAAKLAQWQPLDASSNLEAASRANLKWTIE
jgi:transcriptional regulator with XRE-family HTH domain